MVEFDPRHLEALNLQAQELLNEVRIMDAPPPRPTTAPTNPVHPVFTFTAEHIIGNPTFFERVTTIDGEERARFWTVGGRRIGWAEESHRKIRVLASGLASKGPLKGIVSFKFVLEEIFTWLRDTLEKKSTDTLPERLKRRCEEEVHDIELWIPLNQTYAKESFSIGYVTFRTITKDLMDAWYGRLNPPPDPAVSAELNRQRSKLQATLAACTIVHAERSMASQVALERTVDAVALLRFISEANWTCRIRSYCTPLGMQRDDVVTELNMENGAIKNTSGRVLRPETAAWNVDRCRHQLPGMLEKLHGFASDNSSTELRKALFEALLIYSKNTLTLDLAEKLVFVLVSLESLLLRDSSEPIQGNLAERLAFLCGETLEERKEIVAITKKAYALRSQFVHHGRGIEDVDALDKFLLIAWQALANLISNFKNFARREDLISYLNDRRLA
jgi:hypothetical protein